LLAFLLTVQKRRRASGLFTGKQGYMTLRDLFRWGERFRLASDEEKSNGKQLLAENGKPKLSLIQPSRV
jgi:midasin